MIVLSIRTDKPEAEIALYENQSLLHQEIWYAHRELAEKLLQKIQDLLTATQIRYEDIGGVICYEGPGSFTGLRIGLTVGNTLAQSLDIPITGASGDAWQRQAIEALRVSPRAVLLPIYGAEAHITQQKK